MEKIEIHLATPEYIQDILAIQREHLISHTDALDDGFLVHEMDQRYVDALIHDKEALIEIARVGEHTAGYLVAYPLALQENSRRDAITISDKDDEHLIKSKKILYMKHIATKKGFGSKGIGTKLWEMCFSQARQRGYTHIVCEIAEYIHLHGKGVENTFSLGYHTKRGFHEIGKVNYGEGESQELRRLILAPL